MGKDYFGAVSNYFTRAPEIQRDFQKDMSQRRAIYKNLALRTPQEYQEQRSFVEGPLKEPQQHRHGASREETRAQRNEDYTAASMTLTVSRGSI